MRISNVVSAYRECFFAKYANRLQPHHYRAVDAVLACRTERAGEVLLNCDHCSATDAHFLSCGNRSCPRCQNHDTTGWLERQRNKLLPVDYFMVTFTLPFELRDLVWKHQTRLYDALIQCAVSTLKTFGINDKKLGGLLGMTAVLHTHSRRLEHHPHVHIIVPGGCVNKKRNQWKKLEGDYLFNAFALAGVFRARFIDALNQAGLRLPRNIVSKWVVDCEHVGRGLPALRYLSRYLYRGVISERNILSDDGRNVTFQYRDSQTKTLKTRTVPGEQFLWLVFQHVLPKGFRRARDYGFLHGNAKKLLRLIQLILIVHIPQAEEKARPCFSCRHCGRPMSVVRVIRPG